MDLKHHSCIILKSRCSTWGEHRDIKLLPEAPEAGARTQHQLDMGMLEIRHSTDLQEPGKKTRETLGRDSKEQRLIMHLTSLPLSFARRTSSTVLLQT